jgi:hypothetical protein
VYQLGASSRATFKYSAVPYHRRHDSRAVPNPKLPEHDAKFIQDTLEGLRLMSLLKCVHFLLFLTLVPLTKLDSGVPRHRHSTSPPSPPNTGPTLGPVASPSSQRSTRQTSRCVCSHTAVSPPARPTSLRIRPKIRAPITNSSVPFL